VFWIVRYCIGLIAICGRKVNVFSAKNQKLRVKKSKFIDFCVFEGARGTSSLVVHAPLLNTNAHNFF
jgi:hypothetical protein